MKDIWNKLGHIHRKLDYMSLRVLAILMVALLVTLFAGKSQLAKIAWAQSATVSVSPDSQTIFVGDSTTVGIRIDDVTDLYGAEVHLSFDPAILEVTGISEGDLLDDGSGFTAQSEYSNTAGTIDYARTLTAPADPVSDDGVLITITFMGLGLGTSTISFTDALLANRDGIVIPSSTSDGPITVTASIGDYVWIDETGDGIQDDWLPFPPYAEVGINGVDMELWEDTDASGTFSETMDTRVMTTTTKTNLGNDGWYLFTGLSAGTYFVRIAPAEFDSGGTLWDYNPTKPNAGSDDTVNSDGDNPTCPYDPDTETGTCGQALFEDNILAKTTLSVSDDLTIDFGVVAGAPPTAVTLSSFAAESSAGGSASRLWLGFAGLVLAAGSLFWVKRRVIWSSERKALTES